jgi:hypothetical protein
MVRCTMSRSTTRWSAVLILVTWTASGCYRYIPTRAEEIPPGEHVRIFVNRSVLESIGEVRTFEEPLVRGLVMRRENEELFVRIPVGVRREGFHSAEIGQDVRIPFRDVVSIERRQLDRLATSGLVAGTAGAAAFVLFVIMEAFQSEDDFEECPGGVCEELLTPIFRIPLR